MKVEKRDGQTERNVLTGLIVSKTVVARIAPKWEKPEGLFRSPWANLVGQWCVDYFNKYGKPPAREIEGLFRAWADKGKKDKDTVALVEKFLGGLSGEYEAKRKKLNPEFLADQAADHFTRVKLQKLAESIQGNLDAGRVEDAAKLPAAFNKVEVSSSRFVDVLNDQAAVKEVYEHRRESLISWPGDLGRFYGNEFEREAFIAYLAPPKRGKTYQLLDVAWRAMSQRKRVAFFEVGDLSLRQILSRFYTRALGRPLKATHPDRPVLVPVKLEAGDSPIPDVEFDTRVYKSDATLQEIEAAIDRAKMKTKSKDPYLRVQFHPTKSITARGVKAALLDWSRDGWTADVVVVDYADILAPSHGFKESRDAVNDTWQQLRRMSQELHCCVVTATQGNAASFNTDSLDMSNFSEDNRKLAHVTGMIAINQKQDEKKQQLQRLGWVVLREDEFHVSRQIWIANCLAIANPTVRTLLM